MNEEREELLPKEEVLSKNDRYLETSELTEEEFSKDWEFEEETKKVVINKAIVREIVRRKTCMRIIKLLFKHKEPLIIKEVWENLGISRQLASSSLRRLEKTDIIEQVTAFPMDRSRKYYQITDYDLAKKLIKRFHYSISFTLAKILAFSVILVDELKKKPDFLEICNKYGLTLDEGVEALKMNHRKVESVYSDYYDGHKLTGFKRKEQ